MTDSGAIVSLPERVLGAKAAGALEKDGTLLLGCLNATQPITISEDPKYKRTQIQVGEKTVRIDQDRISRIRVEFCREANNFTYQLLGGNKAFSAPRDISIIGGSSFDYISFKLDNNGHGRPITLKTQLRINMDLKDGQDQVEVRTRDIAPSGLLEVKADLGAGHDGFTWVTHSNVTWAGDVTLDLNAGEDDDQVFISMAQDVSIAASSNARFTVYGDSRGTLSNPRDNVADHGADKILASFKGTVKGRFDMKLQGDDGLLRIQDLECRTSEDCIFRYQLTGNYRCPERIDINTSMHNQCIDLERALKFASEEVVGHHVLNCRLPGSTANIRLRPCSDEVARNYLRLLTYAQDTVQARVKILEGSTGSSDINLDGGLASDHTVLLYSRDTVEASRHTKQLSGGQTHRYKTDHCFPQFVYGTPSQGCDVFSQDIIVSELQN